MRTGHDYVLRVTCDQGCGLKLLWEYEKAVQRRSASILEGGSHERGQTQNMG